MEMLEVLKTCPRVHDWEQTESGWRTTYRGIGPIAGEEWNISCVGNRNFRVDATVVQEKVNIRVLLYGDDLDSLMQEATRRMGGADILCSSH